MEFRPMHTFAVFLLIACLLFLSVEGRLLKSVSKDDPKQVFSPPPPTETSDFGDSVEGHKEDFRPTTPRNSPGVGHSCPEDDEDIAERKPSISRDEDGFRHTTPGNSPGAGHSFEDNDEDVEKKPSSISKQGNGKHSIAGHSPGVGHAYPNQHSEPNA
ncbi:hypothetical protein ES288_D03G022400v1 [Gossypium darwinii]|uniref:Precursor of CEP9 n=1 Tax=Gossypium darwinii TaxID=34276 RepID=A0A5D2D0X7_GOSDA|nr:hypothetical protein ES288_D03G022400v1 [Gossypium darwinii]